MKTTEGHGAPSGRGDTFLEEAKKAYWRAGRRKTPAFRDKLRELLLEKLAQAGELSEEDISWVEARVQEF